MESNGNRGILRFMPTTDSTAARGKLVQASDRLNVSSEPRRRADTAILRSDSVVLNLLQDDRILLVLRRESGRRLQRIPVRPV
jgi:hypothetical protein